MKLHESKSSEKNVFTGYGAGYVLINQKRYENNLVIMPDHIIDDWQAQTFEQLTAKHFDLLLPFQPEIVLLGTGNTLYFPNISITKELISLKIGVEVMDTSAACRTYNILMEEGRNVAAALLL